MCKIGCIYYLIYLACNIPVYAELKLLVCWHTFVFSYQIHKEKQSLRIPVCFPGWCCPLKWVLLLKESFVYFKELTLEEKLCSLEQILSLEEIL